MSFQLPVFLPLLPTTAPRCPTGQRVGPRQGSEGKQGLRASACAEAPPPPHILLLQLRCLVPAPATAPGKDHKCEYRSYHSTKTPHGCWMGALLPSAEPPVLHTACSKTHPESGRTHFLETLGRRNWGKRWWKRTSGNLKRWGTEEAISIVRILTKTTCIE